MPDYQAIVEGPGFKQIIYLEIKTLGTPKSTREAVNLLVRRIQNEPEIVAEGAPAAGLPAAFDGLVPLARAAESTPDVPPGCR